MNGEKVFAIVEAFEERGKRRVVSNDIVEKDHDFIMNVLAEKSYVAVIVSTPDHNFHFFTNREAAEDHIEDIYQQIEEDKYYCQDEYEDDENAIFENDEAKEESYRIFSKGGWEKFSIDKAQEISNGKELLLIQQYKNGMWEDVDSEDFIVEEVEVKDGAP